MEELGSVSSPDCEAGGKFKIEESDVRTAMARVSEPEPKHLWRDRLQRVDPSKGLECQSSEPSL